MYFFIMNERKFVRLLETFKDLLGLHWDKIGLDFRKFDNIRRVMKLILFNMSDSDLEEYTSTKSSV